jgi:nuclear mRNA export protein PCID2/THP1
VQNLTYAAEKIPTSKFKANKRLVLMYLIPAKIMRGSLPSLKLLESFDMMCYIGIVKALRSGNLSLFDSALEEHEYLFIHKGLYLVLQRMRLIVFRSLCKKVFRTRVAMKAERPNVLNLDDYRMGLRACEVDLPRSEAECIIANLIFNGYVKGYISHKLGFLVLSTKMPFPELQSVQPKQLI